MNPAAHDDVVEVVVLAGEHDISTVDALEASLEALLEERRPVVLDLGDCMFLDALVLDLLVRTGVRFRDAMTGYVVALPVTAEPVVRRMVLELAPATAALPVVPSVARAARMAAAGVTGIGEPATALLADLQERLWHVRGTSWRSAAAAAELREARTQLLFSARATLGEIRSALAPRAGAPRASSG